MTGNAAALHAKVQAYLTNPTTVAVLWGPVLVRGGRGVAHV